MEDYFDDILDIYEDEWKTNREKKLKPKKVFFWCCCDMSIIGSGQKCKVCGHKEPHRKLKK